MKKNYNSKILLGLMLGLSVSFGCSKEEAFETLDPSALQNENLAKKSGANLLDGSVNPRIKMKAHSYIVMSISGELPADLKSQLKALKGELTSEMSKIGIATVHSTDPDFAAKAGKIKGVGSVVRDLEI